MVFHSKNQNFRTRRGAVRWYVTLVLFLALAGGWVLAGCDASPQQTLIGKWHGTCDFSVSSGIAFQQVEFLANETYIQDGYVGSYTFLDSRRLEIRLGGPGVVLTFSFPADNVLTLTDSSGMPCTLTRETAAASIKSGNLTKS